ncbi:MAG: hypothetical protein LWX01_11830 [Deltaproteobacteria bacterium]|nr:hypothetical protein [Deltaproteobacteria bacterium]MDL1962359.1 hypothetical protein [Deltaproteobacteria bacterium]
MEEKELVKSIESIEKDWQHTHHPALLYSTGMSATMTEMDTAYSLDIAEETVLIREQSPGVALIVPCLSGGGEPDIEYLGEGKKYLWREAILPLLAYASAKQPFIYAALEEYLGSPGEAVASTSPWPDLWERIEPEPARLRGVFSHTPHRKVLFSETLKFKTADLPRWKPKVIIGLRTFEEEDD